MPYGEAVHEVPPRTHKAAVWRRALTTIFAFVAVGPPVGGLMLGLLFDVMLLYRAATGPSSDLHALPMLFLAPLMFMIGSYVVGGVAAFISGVVYAVIAIGLETPTPAAACLSAVVGTLIFVSMLGGGKADPAAVMFGAVALSIPAALMARRVAHEGGSEPV